MLSYTDLTPGTQFIMDGEPYEVVDYAFVRMQQRKPSVQTKIRNLISGKVVAKTFQPSDTVKEADIKRETATGGTKMVTLENGLQIQAPLFIDAGDVIRVNTESGDYTERVSKSK